MLIALRPGQSRVLGLDFKILLRRSRRPLLGGPTDRARTSTALGACLTPLQTSASATDFAEPNAKGLIKGGRLGAMREALVALARGKT